MRQAVFLRGVSNKVLKLQGTVQHTLDYEALGVLNLNQGPRELRSTLAEARATLDRDRTALAPHSTGFKMDQLWNSTEQLIW
jgi:hypothetical protein